MDVEPQSDDLLTISVYIRHNALDFKTSKALYSPSPKPNKHETHTVS